MTDQNDQTPAQQPAADPNAPSVTPQAVYIKDCSFEAPSGPFIGGLEGQPQVNMTMRAGHNALGQNAHEVVLNLRLEAKAGDKVVWLCELQQAGAFVIQNLNPADLAQVLNIMAPNYLLSFARSTVAELVTKGGFPPFLLPLVSFEALQARRNQQGQPAAAAPTTTVN
jgi:preprotein translocase subunit SecB